MPGRVSTYLRRLDIDFRRNDHRTMHQLASATPYWVKEDTDSQNFGPNGATGHDLYFFVEEEFFKEISISEQRQIAEEFRRYLNECCESVSDEYWNQVHIELADEGDSLYQKAIKPGQRTQVNADTLSFWRSGEIRMFISHRDGHKKKAFELQKAMDAYGISSFVAHETIKPTKEWAREIMSGLETMEIMLVFLTDDFAESVYTNQEVGFALGRSIPIIALKLETKDPPGFISSRQALRGSIANPAAAALELWKLVADQLGMHSRIQASAISAFTKAQSFNDAKEKFETMRSIVEKLTETQISTISQAYQDNSQLYGAGYLSGSRRLLNFLEKTTGRTYKIEARVIKEVKPKSALDDDIPF